MMSHLQIQGVIHIPVVMEFLSSLIVDQETRSKIYGSLFRMFILVSNLFSPLNVFPLFKSSSIRFL